MRKTRNLVPSGASVRIRPTSRFTFEFWRVGWGTGCVGVFLALVLEVICLDGLGPFVNLPIRASALMGSFGLL